MAGALAGITVIELASMGPGPFAGMMLADHGARVIRVARPGDEHRFGHFPKGDILNRNREELPLDLKLPEARAALLEQVKEADALIEGFRPGTLERMGLGPDVLLAANPRLVIGRMTGWGQDGPLAASAGHDIVYIALAGALHGIGPEERPVPPLNLLGDFGGGGMMLAFGLLAGILSARSTGQGQVIDCAMVDGAALLTAQTRAMIASGMWREGREANILDGGAFYYGAYETADGKWIALGSLEDQFYAALLERLGLAGDPLLADRADPGLWPAQRARLADVFRTRTRDQWCALLEATDACFAPVLTMAEAPEHPHNLARGTFVEANGLVQPAPAPRFSHTPAPPIRPAKS